MSWDTGWQSPDEREAQQRAAIEAQQQAEMTPFEKQALRVLIRLADAVDALGATMAFRQPAHPICAHCGTEQPIAGAEPVPFDARVDRVVERIAEKYGRHPDLSYPVWSRVVADVLNEMQWIPRAEAAAPGQVDAAGVGDVDSGGPPDAPSRPAAPDFTN